MFAHFPVLRSCARGCVRDKIAVYIAAIERRWPPFLPAGKLAQEERSEEAITVINGGLVLAPKSIDLQ